MKKLLLSIAVGMGSLTATSAMAASPYFSVPQDAQLKKSYLMLESAITEVKDNLELLNTKAFQAEVRSAEAQLQSAANFNSGTEVTDLLTIQLARIEEESIKREIDAQKLKLKDLEKLAIDYGHAVLVLPD